MATQELHRGRLIDHIQLVVKDLSVSQDFYAAVFQCLGIPMSGSGDGYFWADELFISTRDNPAAQGVLAGGTRLPAPADADGPEQPGPRGRSVDAVPRLATRR